MIQLLATRYKKEIAYTLSLVFYMGMIIPAYGMIHTSTMTTNRFVYSKNNNRSFNDPKNTFNSNRKERNKDHLVPVTIPNIENKNSIKTKPVLSADLVYIDGPSQPEMTSFKPAGTNDMVNLFTGDFSYNIPLLDVGGYPVNIFYNGGISMEQEASWVGLGWNINPGNVNRNMRGVPDDFNGEETLIQQQNMKKNITWGIALGGDLELIGKKQTIFEGFSGSVGATLGYSLNNYLGPAIELGLKGTTGYGIAGKSSTEKSTIGVSVGLNANLNSRAGMTLTPNLSLAANANSNYRSLSVGVGLSTSYNSRSGIKSLQLSEQMSMNYEIQKNRKGKTAGYEVNRSSMGANIFSSSISFVKPSYSPAMRPIITNSSGAGRFQFGTAMFGVYGSLEIEGYGQVSSIEPADRTLKKPMVGYLYAQNAKSNPNAVMDFTRFNDQEVTPTTSIISVPQYAYDVFSIQGEGTGGTIRAYRNDNGYVRDNFTSSKDKSWSAGVDIGIPGHVGANFNTVKTPSTIGEWNNGNTLRSAIGFSAAANGWENVYFRNPGENSVLQPNQFDDIGGTDLVRYKLGGTNFSPTIETQLQRLNSSGSVLGDVTVQNLAGISDRKKRTQVISFLTAQEASNIGLDTKIKVYNSNPQNFLNAEKKLYVMEEIERVSDYRKAHHISQINITEADGKRYIYGIPVYNRIQKDFSFTVGNNCTDCTDDLVSFSSNETLVSESENPHLGTGVGGKDGFVQTTEIPPYAHSFLLSGLLSPDYVDVKGDGITEDDLGTSVKFNYTKLADHNWRTPMMNGKANSNPGNLSETRDDKALISYGVRESWYLQSIESKTMIAFFTLEARADGKGIDDGGEFDDINYNDNSIKRLKQIDLYNKADLKKNGLTGAKPIKTVHFGYNYTLCPGTPDNQSGGKLTLERIWFTYNGQNRANKNQYIFSYTKGTTATTGENPSYLINESDRWGNYKPHSDNPQGVKNRDYSYSLQDKTKADQYANPWSLKKILLPSGGQMEIEYESDDYAYVQNKRAAVMNGIIGFSNTNANPTPNLYTVNATGITENNYIFIKVTDACTSRNEVYQKYLQGMDQLLVKLLVNMPKGQEYLTSYAMIEDYDVYDGPGSPAIWIRMKPVIDKGIAYSPLSVTALEYLRERLPAQAFKAYDVSEGTALNQLENMFKGLIEGIKTTFSRIPQYLRENHKAQIVELNRSFARLNDPDGYKYGGGYRVKKIMLKDNWDRMTNQFGSTYGQEYDYTTKEIFNGTERTTSSGVASYEPSIGGEENPFQSIVQISNEVPLGPTSYGAIEMPVMDAFFPAPLVGYSKVTVTSIGKKQNPDPANKKTRSGVGRQVTEFYTAKDFPVYYNYTPLDPAADKQEHVNPTLTFLYKYAFDSRAISQGFLVATNDMHGKMRSQSSYAENDPSTRINYTENFYRNTGVKGLDEKFDFVDNALGGEVQQGNMGIDIELMTDTREFSLKSKSFEIQAQVDWMLPPPFPLWLPFVWPVVSESENTYRAITTTKVINYHAVLDRVVVIDKGSEVSTENLVYDAETGQVVVNRTNNEFDKPVYSVNYPAYWAYSGMGLAYKNIDAVYSGVNFLDGKIISGISADDQKKIFESGDELYIIDPGPSAPQTTTINGSISTSCSDVGCTQQGELSVSFNFSAPTPAALTIQIGKITHSATGDRATGYDIFALPSGVLTDDYYQPNQSHTFNFSIPQGTTSISFPAPIPIGGGSTPWICHNCLFPITALYIKGFSSNNQYQTFFTTSQSYTVNNVPVNTVNCSIPYSDINEKLVWAFNKNKNTNSLTDINPDLIFIDKAGRPYTRTGVKFRIVRSGKRNMLQSPVAAISLMTNPVNPVTHKLTYNAGSKIINASAVEYKEKWQTDNDIFYKYRAETNPTTCEVTEVEDCAGYLEKGINPYRKGLLGNFKGYRNMVFYGDRAETIPTNPTNLLQNGFLTGFDPYWNFNSYNNLVPPDDLVNTKWVWNVQSTRFNSKGMELETKDTLNIYTGAQYGYSKTLPTAITNNSRYDEMAYEGFEDATYDDLLNNSSYNSCTNKHIDLTGLANGQIVNTESVNFNAHTGKYVLGLNGSSTKTFNVNPLNNVGYNLNYTTDVVKTLYDIGGNYQFQNIFPSNCLDNSNVFFTNSNVLVDLFPIDNLPPDGSRSHYYTVTWNCYIQIATHDNYNFDLALTHLHHQYAGVTASNGFNVSISDLDGNVKGSLLISASPGSAYPDPSYPNANGSFSVNLCPGIYRVTASATELYSNPVSAGSDTHNQYVWHCTNYSLPLYKTLSTLNNCVFTKPVPADDLMSNPAFSIPGNKKMVFSAWVRESNSQQTAYTNNEVQIDFGSGNANNVTIKPSGPVIEGWQRYEGYFTAPPGVTQMSLNLVNNTGSMIYFDDIRIHPFNANMKSYVYDPVNLRLRAELDANNYATFYEYDEEGTLIRTKAETREGIKTITESRSAKQKNITDFQ